MPVFESRCPECGEIQEFYAHHATDENPVCPCGGETQRLISRFGVVFTGPITKKYNDPKAADPDREGHIAWRKKSSKSGKPEPCFIETWEQQRAFVREEGLIDPKDLPRHPDDLPKERRNAEMVTILPGEAGTWG